jgi:hypothetical protein
MAALIAACILCAGALLFIARARRSRQRAVDIESKVNPPEGSSPEALTRVRSSSVPPNIPLPPPPSGAYQAPAPASPALLSRSSSNESSSSRLFHAPVTAVDSSAPRGSSGIAAVAPNKVSTSDTNRFAPISNPPKAKHSMDIDPGKVSVPAKVKFSEVPPLVHWDGKDSPSPTPSLSMDPSTSRLVVML